MKKLYCNEVPDRVSKNLVLCSLLFTADSFTNKAQFDAGYSERLKLTDDAVPTVLDHHTILDLREQYKKNKKQTKAVHDPFK